MTIGILGLGEAGSHFANDLARMGIKVVGFDPEPKRALHPAVKVVSSNRQAAELSDIILSVNLSQVAQEVAHEVLPVLDPSKIYVEMNTASPEKKNQIFESLQGTGVQFVDLAIMAPVPPKGIHTPFWVSGNGAKALWGKWVELGLDITLLGDQVGEASRLKLLRSIVYKGVAAVVGEAVEAGKAFGLEAYIRGQITSVIGGDEALIDRFIEGSVTHAGRRMHEMQAVVAMLQEAGVEALMSQAAHDHLCKLKK